MNVGRKFRLAERTFTCIISAANPNKIFKFPNLFPLQRSASQRGGELVFLIFLIAQPRYVNILQLQPRYSSDEYKMRGEGTEGWPGGS